MKKTLSMTAALLALTVGLASAQVNLSWTDCGATGLANRAFACNSNSGTHQLIASYVSPGVTGAIGARVDILMATSGLALGPWYDFSACRSAGGTFLPSSDFSAVPGTGACTSYFDAAVAAGFFVPGEGGPNRARLTIGYALTDAFPDIAPGEEVYAARFQISNARTVGACNGGCADDACYHVAFVQLSHSAGPDYMFTAPADRSFVTWQGGETLDCPGVTPTRKATWGTIKSLYR